MIFGFFSRKKKATLPLVRGAAHGISVCFANYPVLKHKDGRITEASPGFTPRLIDAARKAIGDYDAFRERAAIATLQLMLEIKKHPPLRMDIALHGEKSQDRFEADLQDAIRLSIAAAGIAP